ncbi:MAG: type II secretion system F family protein, partial [Planctomycetaceae bacterium]
MIAPNPELRTIPRDVAFSGLLKEEIGFNEGTGGTADAVNGWFDSLMLQSGIQTAPSVWLALCVLSGISCGGLFFVLTDRLVMSSVMAALGLLLPIVYALVLKSRRQARIMQQLPLMAEEMARFARTGRNVEHAFMMLAADTPSPLGNELRVSARRIEMGMDVGSACRDLVQRTGVTTLTMFTAALSVNQETGGDLIQVLERLSTAIRDRLHFVARQRAATISSRLGSVMMITVPIIVIGFYVARDPAYLDKLFASGWGRSSFWTAVALQLVGSLIVFRI